METKRVYFLVHGGKVQGVGFRHFTRRKATELQLTGWVRNLPNNKVEGEAQGDDKLVDVLIKAIDRGPTYAKVVRLDKEERALEEGETEFVVRHSDVH